MCIELSYLSRVARIQTPLPGLVKGRQPEAPFSLHFRSRAFSRSRLTV